MVGKRLLSLLLLLPALCWSDSYTTNAGLVKPDDGSTGWGPKLRANYDIIDSSFAILSADNIFTGNQTFVSIDISTITPNLIRFDDRQASVAIGNGTFDNYVGNAGNRPSVGIGTSALAHFIGQNLIGGFGGGQTAVGYGALANLQYGVQNTSVGDFSCAYLTTGSYNVCMGYGAGFGVGGGNEVYVATNSIFIGQYTGPNLSTTKVDHSVAIGAFTNVNINDALVLGPYVGSSAGTPFTVGIGTDTPRERLHIVGNFRVDAGSIIFNNGTTQSSAGAGVSSTNTFTGGNTFQSTTTFNNDVLFKSTVSFSPSTIGIKGTQTNDDASGGFVGQYVSSTSVGQSNFPGTTTFGDLLSISLTAGDWDVSSVGYGHLNGATMTTWEIGISTTSGNSQAGLTLGDNRLDMIPPTAGSDLSVSIPTVRFPLASTTTVYFKYSAQFSAGTPQMRGRLSARRVR